jgi:hypothetical protein
MVVNTSIHQPVSKISLSPLLSAHDIKEYGLRYVFNAMNYQKFSMKKNLISKGTSNTLQRIVKSGWCSKFMITAQKKWPSRENVCPILEIFLGFYLKLIKFFFHIDVGAVHQPRQKDSTCQMFLQEKKKCLLTVKLFSLF